MNEEKWLDEAGMVVFGLPITFGLAVLVLMIVSYRRWRKMDKAGTIKVDEGEDPSEFYTDVMRRNARHAHHRAVTDALEDRS